MNDDSKPTDRPAIPSDVQPQMVRCAVSVAEQELRGAIQQVMRFLHYQTGLYVCDIDVQIIDTATHNQRQRTELGHVSIKLR